ncbi:MAG: shikimate kinase [Planctomycetales bacterium]|nr:shikimate kinase [Planctomycetales bacterium]
MLISLIGYRGTGKTTIGSLLADRIGWSCIDSDVQIEQDMGMSIRQIFDIEGEEGFRNRESTVIEKLTRLYKVVLSLGGGAILREQNRKLIKTAGPVVWLTASPEELHRRISGDPLSSTQRPNLTAAGGGLEEIKAVLENRKPLYKECADLEVDTEGKLPGQIVDEIIKLIGLDDQRALG